MQEARRNAEIQGWDDYEQLAGVHEPKDIPPRVLELVQKEGMTPVGGALALPGRAGAAAEPDRTEKRAEPPAVGGEHGGRGRARRLRGRLYERVPVLTAKEE